MRFTTDYRHRWGKAEVGGVQRCINGCGTRRAWWAFGSYYVYAAKGRKKFTKPMRLGHSSSMPRCKEKP